MVQKVNICESIECGRVAMNGRRRRLIIIRHCSEWTVNYGRGLCWPGTDVKRIALWAGWPGLVCTVRDTDFGLGGLALEHLSRPLLKCPSPVARNRLAEEADDDEPLLPYTPAIPVSLEKGCRARRVGDFLAIHVNRWY